MQKVTHVHVKVAPQRAKNCEPGNCGYEYSFEPTTGTLDVGVHNRPSNLDVEAAKWLKQQ